MKQVLAKIKPSTEEEKKFNKTSKEFLTKLNSKLRGAKAILGGSGAKGTWLAGNHDIDIFVLYDYKKFRDKSTELSNKLEPVLRRTFPKAKLSRLHGSRDYFQFKYEGLSFEVVPILKINKAEKALNITDISPLHAIWVNKNVKRKEDVLLAKQFFRAHKLYGAESHITGFSGYVLEILIAKYGTFQKLLKASLGWKLKEVVDVAGYFKGKNVMFELNKSKTQSPIIVIDPVDKFRNAAAALSDEKFSLLRKVAKKYLNKPDASLFERKEVIYDKLLLEAKKKKQNLVFFNVIAHKGKDDVVGAKLMKVFEHMKKKLSVFDIAKSDWDWERGPKAVFYFFTKKKELPKTEIRIGPPTKMKDHVKRFKKLHKKTSVKNGKIVAEVKVKFPKLDNFVKNLLKDEYVKDRVKGIRKK